MLRFQKDQYIPAQVVISYGTDIYSVVSVTKLISNLNDAVEKCIPSINTGYVCKTCYNSLKSNNIPKCSVPGTDTDMSTISATGTKSAISTVAVPGTISDIGIVTATPTATTGICAITVAGTTTSTTSVASADLPTVVGYSHNVSPMKRNKKDTLSYATFTLQLDKKETCDALCYSKSKQLILADKEFSRSPVKITKFTRTPDRTKLVINDITHVTPSNSLECPFQFDQNLNDQTTTTLDKLDQAPEDKLTVIGKIIQLSETKIVSQGKYKVANTTTADQTAHITLDVWNDLIPQIQENKVYKFTHLSVRFWNGIRKLTTTTNTIISEEPNSPLHSLQVENISTPQQEKTLHVSSIESIESLEKFKVCAHCGKRIIQVQDLLLKCDHCHHKMRASKCPTKLTASIVVKNESTNIYLSVRDDVLQKLFGPYDPDTMMQNGNFFSWRT